MAYFLRVSLKRFVLLLILLNCNIVFRSIAQTTAVSNMSRNTVLLNRDNELHIIQESSPCHSLKVYTDNGTIKSAGKCTFVYKPERLGMGQIIVKGPKGEYNYLVRVEEASTQIEVYIGYFPQGPIHRVDIARQLGIIIKENGIVTDKPHKVLSYSMMINRENKVINIFSFKGPKFSAEAIQELQKVQIHDQVLIYNIVVEDHAGQAKYLQPAQFMIK